MSTDTAVSMIQVLDKMTDSQYLYLLLRLLLVFIGVAGGALAALAAIYKGFIFLWAAAMKHIRLSLSLEFATPGDMKQILDTFKASQEHSLDTFKQLFENGFASIRHELRRGEDRMNQIEDRCWEHRGIPPFPREPHSSVLVATEAHHG